MAGTNVPFVQGSASDYAHALDRLEQEARSPDRRASWLSTLALCATLAIGSVTILPGLPDKLANGAATAAPRSMEGLDPMALPRPMLSGPVSPRAVGRNADHLRPPASPRRTRSGEREP